MDLYILFGANRGTGEWSVVVYWVDTPYTAMTYDKDPILQKGIVKRFTMLMYLFLCEYSNFSRPLGIGHCVNSAKNVTIIMCRLTKNTITIRCSYNQKYHYHHLQVEKSITQYSTTSRPHLTFWAFVKSSPRLSVFFLMWIGSVIPVLNIKR